MAEYPPGKDDAKKKGPKGGWAGMRANAEDVSDKIEPEHVDKSANENAPSPEPLNEDYLALKKAEQDLADAQEANRASLEAREAAREKLRNLDRIREDARRAMSGEPPLTDEEWEHLKRESSEEKPIDTDVHAENVGRFKSFMRGAVEKLGGAKEAVGKGYEASAAFLSKRSEELGAKAKELGPAVESFISARGEWYNKQNKFAKIGIGVGMGVGAAAFSTVSWPIMMAFWTGIGLQRALGGAGMYLKFEKHLHETKAGIGERNWFARQKWYQDIANRSGGANKFDAALLTIAYTIAFGDTIREGVHLASDSALGEATHEWLKNHWPGGLGTKTPVSQSTPAHTPALEVPQPAEVLAAQHAAEHVASVAPAAPELAPVSVEAHAGDGGIKLFKHLQEAIAKAPGFDPNHLSPVQEHILHGDPTKLAEEYGLYKPNEALESAKVLGGSSLGFDAHGDLIFTQHGAAEMLAQNHGYEGAFVHAGHHAGVAPEHAQLHEVRARLGITEEQQTVELNRMSLEAHQTIDHPAPAPVGPEIAPSASGVSLSQEVVSTASHPLGHFDDAMAFAQTHLSEPHLYTDAGSKHLFVIGGTPKIQADVISKWLIEHPKSVVYGTDDTGVYRIPYTLGPDGKVVANFPVRTGGMFGFFSSWMKAPALDEIKKLVQ